MTDPAAPRRPVLEPRPDLGGGRDTPAFALPSGAPSGLPDALGTTIIGSVPFAWGTRTFVMGIVNMTPDSFSGDGILAEDAGPGGGSGQVAHRAAAADRVAAAATLAESMVAAGADVIDVGGESTRPGHAEVDAAMELGRVVPVIAAIRAALPDTPISVDTTKVEVATAALEAGADLINDVWGVADDDEMVRLAAERDVPIVLMHNRAEARYTNLVPEVVADLQRAIERALRVGVAWDDILVDPGFGFGKTADHNIALLRELQTLAILGRPIVLGTSRKSTLGRVLDLPAGERLEATLATTALAVASGVDMVRVHDVRENVRAARMADAVARGTWPADAAGARR